MTAAEYLLTAARGFVRPAGAPPLPAWDEGNGAELLRLAAEHGVLTPLARHLPPGALPPQLARELGNQAAAAANAALARTGELLRVAEALQARGIACLALKGPWLSLRLHGDLTLRSSGDLDILVRRNDRLEAIDALETVGYALAGLPGWPAKSVCASARDAQVTLFAAERQAAVDLHWRCVPPYLPDPCAGAAERAWRQPARRELAGCPMAEFDDDALLLFLCAHAAKHAFERLSWIWDIAACLALRPGYGWEPALTQARATGTTRMLGVGTRLAAQLFGVTPPSMADDTVATRLTAVVMRRLAAAISGHTPAAVEIAFVLRLMQRPGQRLRYLAGQLQPSRADTRAWPLPARWRGLYWPMRPARLAWRIATRASNGQA